MHLFLIVGSSHRFLLSSVKLLSTTLMLMEIELAFSELQCYDAFISLRNITLKYLWFHNPCVQCWEGNSRLSLQLWVWWQLTQLCAEHEDRHITHNCSVIIIQFSRDCFHTPHTTMKVVWKIILYFTACQELKIGPWLKIVLLLTFFLCKTHS